MARPRATSLAHEFRRDEERQRSAKAFAVVMRRLRGFEHLFAAEILALGDVDHFLGDDVGPRPFELGEGLAGKPAQRLRRVGEIAGEMLAGDVAVVDRLDRPAVVFLDTAALAHPFDPRARQALRDVDRGVGVGIRPGRVVDRQRRLAGRGVEHDLAQRHFQLGRRVRPRIDFTRAGDRSGGDLRRGEIGFGKRLVHRCAPGFSNWRMIVFMRDSP